MLSYASLSDALADERERAVREKSRTAAERQRRGELRLRPAVDADMASLVRLARLDSSRPPAGAIFVAEDAGEIVAATSLDDGATIADPFRATAEVVALLKLRVEQMQPDAPRGPRGSRRFLRRLRPGASTA